MKKILVVGGVAGGASFAARMRRLDEKATIVIFDKGDYISFANCGLPYYIGGTITERDNLILQTPERFSARFKVDVRTGSEVISVDAVKKIILVKDKNGEYREQYDYLLLAPGCTPIKPPVPGIDSHKVYTLRNIPDTDAIRSIVDKGGIRRATVIGGGFIGLEMAENLKHQGIAVTIVELSDQVFIAADREMVSALHQHLVLNGIRLELGHGLKEIVDTTTGPASVILDNGTAIASDMIILAVGVKPDTSFLSESSIELSKRGAIVVDDHMRTSLPDVYAVGDAIEVTDYISNVKTLVPLAGPANRQGRIAADNMAGFDSRYMHTQGTAICKVFDFTVAVTGLNEKNAKRLHIPYMKSYIHTSSHASYYPGAYPLSIKLLFDPVSGRILGAQVLGREGVDKRIDVFATALRHRLTVYALSELELAYAPPYGSAKDPVNMAGFVATNILNKLMPVWFAEDFETIDTKCNVLLDVRSREEHEQAAIPGSVNIPVDELREHCDTLDINKEYLVYCQVGLRGYLALRILLQNGFSAKNLSGGYKTWSAEYTKDYDARFVAPVQEAACNTPVHETGSSIAVTVDACGLQCPGPISKVKTAVDSVNEGDVVQVYATDQGFAADIPAWCRRTNNILVNLEYTKGKYCATIRKGMGLTVCSLPNATVDKKTIVVFSNELDKMIASFIIANGAAAMGSTVVMFFTFWGLTLLRKKKQVSVKKTFVEKMFGIMMPRGSAKTRLSKINMGGLGTLFMRRVMKKKNVYSLEELIAQARTNGIKFIACTMSMDIIGIKKEELIDGVEFGGVASYLADADEAAYNLFI